MIEIIHKITTKMKTLRDLKKWKKLLVYFFGGIILFFLGFRYSPYIIPVEKEDIAREQFHSVKFYDRNGNLLQEVLSKDSTRSVHVDLDMVSSYFLDALIATEDKNFYRHHGIDYMAVLRAARQNLESQEIVSGASTITLQLARLIHPAERTLFSKIKEAYFAYRLEAGMDKESILEEYINRLPMGGNLYGIEGASKAYFGIPSSDLTLAQATFLASIPNSPNQLNPYHNLKEIKKRQRIVLESMIKQGMISNSRLEGVLKEDVLLKPQNSYFLAPHFVFHLMKSLPDGAQTVKTTIDIEIQKMVLAQVKNVLSYLKDYHVTNASAILFDNRTGQVLAYVGSADYFNTDIDGQNDGIQALRQPGSTLKPFLYLLAMENGFNPATLISDLPTHYRMPTGIYSPKNYSESFHGPVRLREALANSLNVPAVRVLAKIGVDRFLNRLHGYRFDSLNQDAEFYGVGLTLGGGEVTLYELNRAYMCLSRMGSFIPVNEILATNGKKSAPDSEEVRISTPQLNYLIADILGDHFARAAEFGFHSVLNLPFPCSVKTGTSFRFCDNWTVGYTEDYTLGVWVGNFDHTPMLKVSGVSGAGPIFANIMSMLYNKKEYPEKFTQPEGLVRITICPLSGKKPSKYCPTSIEELIPQRDYVASRDICDMHVKREEVVSTMVPAKYQDWAKQMGIKTQTRQPGEEKLFQIVNPKDGAVYYRLSNLKPEYQSVRFQLNCSDSDQKVNWFLNAIPIKTTSNGHTFLWTIHPGQFVLKAVSEENALSSSVEFEVR
jgi:penicillin-binding protein 1C